jgi:hypothetical protein
MLFPLVSRHFWGPAVLPAVIQPYPCSVPRVRHDQGRGTGMLHPLGDGASAKVLAPAAAGVTAFAAQRVQPPATASLRLWITLHSLSGCRRRQPASLYRVVLAATASLSLPSHAVAVLLPQRASTCCTASEAVRSPAVSTAHRPAPEALLATVAPARRIRGAHPWTHQKMRIPGNAAACPSSQDQAVTASGR